VAETYQKVDSFSQVQIFNANVKNGYFIRGSASVRA